MLAGHKQRSAAASHALPNGLLRLATTLMQAGAGSSESWVTAALRPFLTGLVAGLCRQSASPEDCRWDAAVTDLATQPLFFCATGAAHL